MKLHKTLSISIRIIFIFICGMIMSTIPEFFPELFGDWICVGSQEEIMNGYYHSHYTGCNYAGYDFHLPTNHWGYRHWLFFFMGLSLFIVQVVSLIIYIGKDEKSK